MATGTDARGLPSGYVFRPEYELDAPEVKRLMSAARPALTLIDVRTHEELRVARVPGAEHVPLDELEAHLASRESDGTPLVFMCHHGMRSMKAALLARAAGFAGAMSVAGGIDAWSLSADLTIPRY